MTTKEHGLSTSDTVSSYSPSEASIVTNGKSIRIFLADGTPGGLLTAEIVNWTGHVAAAPRSDLAALLQRPDTARTGVYILLGDDPENPGGQLAYVGEGDDVSTRLKKHAQPYEKGGKDFWDRALVVTSKDSNVTKTHARYLESRLISLARLANRARLDNGTAPPPIRMSEAEESDMESFISRVQIVLPVLGVNIFRSAITIAKATNERAAVGPLGDSPIFELRLRKDDLLAVAREVDGEFTVLAGSHVREKWIGSDHHDGYNILRDRLMHDSTILPAQDGRLQFTHDTVFSSPSAAAAVVVGRGANGRNDWRVQDTGISYGEWQNQGIDTVG